MGWPGPMTNRQYLAWLWWLDEEWKRPTRSDFYQMQTAMEVRRTAVKNPRRVKLKHFELKFGRQADDKPAGGLSVEEATALSQARWFALAGMGPDYNPAAEHQRKVLRGGTAGLGEVGDGG